MFKRWIIKIAIKWLKEIDDRDKKREILTEAVKHLYNAISDEDILKQNPDGKWLFEGRPITSQEVINLKEEARVLSGMRIWKVLKLDIRYQLSRKMFEEARCEDDILWGQLTTFLWDIIQTRLKRLK